MLDDYISQLANGKSLTQDESYRATLLLLSKEAAPDKIITYLKTLHTKGEKPAEILGVIAALKTQMILLPVSHRALDIVGTGGDHANSINISTGAAILAASCGVPIVKHGNRAVSSAAGSADVLEALDIDIEMPLEKILHAFNTLNITFCFAPRFHPALAQLRDIRRQIGSRTIFNLVGPFLNPTSAEHYLMGVASPALLQPFADILSALNIKKSAVVHSDGMDELTCSAITQVIEINEGKQKTYTLEPTELGFKRCDKNDLKGGDAAYNANVLRTVFAGKIGPVADTIILNAAMAIYLYGKENNLMDAIRLSREHLLADKAMELLARWVLFSKKENL
jgi:anthranilate phosphoribosyltransferase